jgi:hypothetical protein
MAKSRYDRNVDRGAAQQRNYGQGAKRESEQSRAGERGSGGGGERENKEFPSLSRSPAPPLFPAQPRVK